MTDKQDAVLAGLVGKLGLEWPAGLDAWEERLRSKLDVVGIERSVGLIEAARSLQVRRVTPVVFFHFGRKVYQPPEEKSGSPLEAPWDDAWLAGTHQGNGAALPSGSVLPDGQAVAAT